MRVFPLMRILQTCISVLGKMAMSFKEKYISRKMCIDFDWSHTHTNKGTESDGRSFQKGVIHVQTYRVEKDGTTTRLSNNARYMNNSEMKKYGPIIKAFNPDVKFRP